MNILEQNIPKYMTIQKKVNNQIYITVPPKYITATLNYLKNNTLSLYKVLSDICCIDWFYQKSIKTNKLKKRFELVYNLMSFKYNNKIFVKTHINLYEFLHTVSYIYKGANWIEREVWDMYGIYFTNHPDLRRILTDYGFEGYPLRKDFPLSGYIEVKYNNTLKRIITKPITLNQEFRHFSFLNPWEKQINY